MTSSRICRFLSLAAIATWFAYTGLGIFWPANPLASLNWYVVTITLVGFGFGHGVRRYGWVSTAGLFVIAAVIATTSEHLSITTGFPFGYYVHTAAMGPQIFRVPVIIGPVYFGLCYLIWAIVQALLGSENAARWEMVIGGPIVAACIVTGFDMCFDPIGATIGRFWLYRDSGGYFGVPLSNYVGWFINAWAIFQCFALFLKSRPVSAVSSGYWYEASVYWFLMGLQYPVLLIATPGSSVVRDSGGWAWRTRDILQNAAISSVYTMILAALLSALAVRLRTAGENGQSTRTVH